MDKRIDPVMYWIYRAYFARHLWKTAGLSDKISLLSALSNLNRNAGSLWRFKPNGIALEKAYEYVRTYINYNSSHL